MKKLTKKEREALRRTADRAATETIARQRKPRPVPKKVKDAEPDKDGINVSFLLQALNIIIQGIQDALEDDGKISLSEAWDIAIQLMLLATQLFQKARR